LIVPPESPLPSKAQLATVRIADDEELDENMDEESLEKLRREREARAQALTLEMVGDLPFAEVKPPENVLFVCKLNPVTQGMCLVSFCGFCLLLMGVCQMRICI
jgi:peptidyl-prolyl cis-trans isomerase-like 4